MGKELVSWIRCLEVAPKMDSSKSDVSLIINVIAFLQDQIRQECVVDSSNYDNKTHYKTHLLKNRRLLCLTLLNNYYCNLF